MTQCIFCQTIWRRLQKFLHVATLTIDLYSLGLLTIILHLCLQSVVIQMLSKNYYAFLFTALLLNAQLSLWFCSTNVSDEIN